METYISIDLINQLCKELVESHPSAVPEDVIIESSFNDCRRLGVIVTGKVPEKGFVVSRTVYIDY